MCDLFYCHINRIMRIYASERSRSARQSVCAFIMVSRSYFWQCARTIFFIRHFSDEVNHYLISKNAKVFCLISLSLLNWRLPLFILIHKNASRWCGMCGTRWTLSFSELPIHRIDCTIFICMNSPQSLWFNNQMFMTYHITPISYILFCVDLNIF